MKRTALILDIKPDSGGGIGMCLTIINYIEKLSLNNFTIIYNFNRNLSILHFEHKIVSSQYN